MSSSAGPAPAAGIGALEGLLVQIVQTAVGYGIGGAISPAVEVAAQPIAKRLWQADPSVPTPAQMAAQASATGRVSRGWAATEAAFQGFGAEPFAALEALALGPPPLETLFELLRRGKLDEAALLVGMLRLGIHPEHQQALLDLRRVHLSPQDAAMARQQAFIGRAQQHAIAAIGGLDPADADLQFELSGLPPGIGEGLELLRRGKIDEARFRQYVHEGHVKTKYEDDLLQLRYMPLSAAVAAEALIRERIPKAKAVQIAEQNGMREEDFLTWSNMLGRPPGIMEALTLVNRGKMTAGDFREVVARSDVRTEYTDQLYELRIHYPSLFQLSRLIAEGALPDARAIQILEYEGYPADLAEGIVKAGHKTKTSSHKGLSLSIIEQLYESGLESKEWFDTALEHLGYDEADRSQLEQLLEVRRLVAEIVHALGLLRSRYTGWKIDRATVVADLDQLLADADARTRLLALWDRERETNRPQLTIAQIGQALKVGRFSPPQAIARWQGLGLSAEDATTHAWIVLKRDPAAA